MPRVPSANDTFSRDRIVPGTQLSERPLQDDLEDELYNPTQEDLIPDTELPTTPVHPPPQGTRQSSMVSKMKRKAEREMDFQGLKKLGPVPVVTPSVFRKYLPPVSQPDEIEEFSSPTKRTQRRQPAPTQDTIEDFDDMVDWTGGDNADANQEATASPRAAPAALSLGPHLDDYRRPAATVLNKVIC